MIDKVEAGFESFDQYDRELNKLKELGTLSKDILGYASLFEKAKFAVIEKIELNRKLKEDQLNRKRKENMDYFSRFQDL